MSRLRAVQSASAAIRLETARAEASSYDDYDYVVVNDELESTVVRLQEIIAAERSRTHRMKPVAEEIIKSFRVDPIAES